VFEGYFREGEAEVGDLLFHGLEDIILNIEAKALILVVFLRLHKLETALICA
jgi:hypothetical protein